MLGDVYAYKLAFMHTGGMYAHTNAVRRLCMLVGIVRIPTNLDAC